MSSLNNNTFPLFSQDKLTKSHSFCFSIIPHSPPTPFIGSDNLYHFTYITICDINSKFYIGKHTTTDFNDNYLGSGTLLFTAIKKYGKQSFTRYIVQFYLTEEDAFIGEANLVNEDVIKVYKDELDMTYNLKAGGTGGNRALCVESRNKISNAIKEAYRNRPEIKDKIREALKEVRDSKQYKEKMGKISSERQATRPLYLPNSTEIVEIHKDDILSKLKEGYRYAGQTAIICNHKKGKNKNIRFFSEKWRIRDFENQNLKLITHLEYGWEFGFHKL
jgi:hypothetical protein